MVEFKYLKKLIIKACKVESVEDLNNAYKFSINIEKLQDLLNQTNAELKVVNINYWDLTEFLSGTEFKSRIPEVSDIQMITEYIQKKNDLEEIFNGKTEIAQFMMYVPDPEHNGEEDNIELLERNNDIDCTTVSKMTGALSTKPVYRVLVIHKFNKKREMFEYTIHFRSNNIMMQYINNMKTSGVEFVTPDDDEEVIEESVE
jgi:hypothetical protein